MHVAKASKVLAIHSPCIKRYRFPIRYTFEDPNEFWEHAQNENKKRTAWISNRFIYIYMPLGQFHMKHMQDKDNMKIVPKLIIQTTKKKNGSLGLTSNLQVGSLT